MIYSALKIGLWTGWLRCQGCMKCGLSGNKCVHWTMHLAMLYLLCTCTEASTLHIAIPHLPGIWTLCYQGVVYSVHWEMQGCMKYGSHQGKCPQPVTLPPFCSTIIILVLVVHSHIIIWWSTFSCVKDHFLIVLVFSLISYHIIS